MNQIDLSTWAPPAGTDWSVYLIPQGGEPVGVRPARLLRTASVAKVFLLWRLALDISSGVVDPEAMLSRSEVTVADSGVWQHLQATELCVSDVAALVGAVSDNWATNTLLDLVGLDRVQDLAGTWCTGGSVLCDYVRDERGPEDPPALSIGCALDWARFMEALHNRSLGSTPVCDMVEGWLGFSVDLSMVASVFDLDPLAHQDPDRGITVWNKTGTNSQVRADVGYVTGPAGELAYAAICNWDPEGPDHRDAVMQSMRALGGIVKSLIVAKA